MQCGATNEWDLSEWLGEVNYQGWIGANGLGWNLYQYLDVWVVSKKGKPTLMGENLQTDHGGKAYGDSDCDLKTNERALAKNMPLLSGYANYGDWETDATRWAMMLHSRPISLGAYFFVINLKGRGTSKIDVESRGCLKHKAKSAIEESEKAILNGELYEPICHEWTFLIFRGEIPRTGRSTYSSKHDKVGWRGESNNSRIGIMGAKSGRCLGLSM